MPPIHHSCHFFSMDKIWVIFCSTQKCVNLSCVAKFGTRSNLSLIHKITKSQNYSTWSKVSCHQKFPCGPKLLHMRILAPRTISAASATNMMYGATLFQPAQSNLLLFLILPVSLITCDLILHCCVTLFQKSPTQFQSVSDYFLFGSKFNNVQHNI